MLARRDWKFMSDTDSVLRVAVAGAAGPSGKSTFAANLAVALASAGKRVVVLDADPAGPLQHRLFGLDMPNENLEAFLQGSVDELYDVVIPTGLPRVYLVPGWQRPPERVLKPAHRARLMRHLDRLGAQVVIMDCGSRHTPDSVDFFNLCDYRLVVATGAPKSAQSAYSFLKNATVRLLDQAATSSDDVALINRFIPAGGTVRISEAIRALQSVNPDLAASLQHIISNYQVGVVVNRVTEGPSEGVGFALSRLVQTYLQVAPRVVGQIAEHPDIETGGRRGRPFLAESIYSSHARGVLEAAEVLLELSPAKIRRQRQRETSLGETLRPKRDVETDDALDQIHNLMRRHERIPVSWRARVNVKDNAAPPGEGDLIDISVSGAAVATQLDVDPGAKVSLWLVDLDDQPKLEAVVRHVKRRGDPRVGLEFIGTDAMKMALKLAAEAKKAHMAEADGPGDEAEAGEAEAGEAEAGEAEDSDHALAADPAGPPPLPLTARLPSLWNDTPIPPSDHAAGDEGKLANPEGAATAPPPAIFPYQKPSQSPRPAQPPPALDEAEDDGDLDFSAFDEPD